MSRNVKIARNFLSYLNLYFLHHILFYSRRWSHSKMYMSFIELWVTEFHHLQMISSGTTVKIITNETPRDMLICEF